MRCTNRISTLSGFLLLVASGCGDEPAKPPPSPENASDGTTAGAVSVGDLATVLARERVAAHLARDERARAREALRPLVEVAQPDLQDLVAGAAIELADNRIEASEAFLARAAKVDPKSPAVAYLRGQVARNSGDMKAAREAFRAARTGAPNDLPTKLALAEAEDELGGSAEAERLYREVVAVGPAEGGAWYVAALYRLRTLLTAAGPAREAEAQRLDPILRAIELRGIQAPSVITVLLGELARVKPPKPAGSRVEPSSTPFTFLAGAAISLPAGTSAIFARDVDGDGLTDIVARANEGIGVLSNAAGVLQAFGPALEKKSAMPVLFDVDNDGDLDLFAIQPEGPVLAVHGVGGHARVEAQFPELPPGVAAVIASDYDHEGDLDLVLSGSFGVRVWRNDASFDRAKDGTTTLKAARFTDASEGSGLPASGEFSWIVAEDFDGDNDVDYLTRGPEGIVVLDSLRDGKFTVLRGIFALPGGLVDEPLVADFDGDARPDLWFTGAPSTLAIQGKPPIRRGDARARPGSLAAADLDLDGSLDVLWFDESTGRLQGLLGFGLANERALVLADPVPTGDRLVIADFDGDCRNDLAIEGVGTLRIFPNTSAAGRGARLAWRGNRDNRRAVGAIVELRAGAIYRRTYWRGEPEVVGIGSATSIDVLRVTWPNGVQSTRLDSAIDRCGLAMDPAEALGAMTQGDGQVGSCPFLYAWNGREFGFISDVLGITPLGLRMAPGMFVPPDHDEYVLVTGEQLVPKDGEYVLQFTEELREVTYLDHARLIVVDSPVGTEIFPNEMFKFPPFPTPRIHALREVIKPLRAIGSDGRDWTAALRAVDDVFPQPMELHPPQFAGLSKPWFLELEFEPEALRGATELRLALTGWFYWSDASANMAAARSEGVAFVPPMFQVPDGLGGWRDTGPPIGFPAGKTKTMVVDVAPFLDPRDPRIRVSTTLRLYWDRIALGIGSDAAIETHSIPTSKIESWRRGFSAPIDALTPGEAHPANRPERFDWNVLAAEPRWNQHPGLYTRHGDVTELVREVDDRFVILGAGDAATLRFDARPIKPPQPGMRRDFLLYLDGWAKDRDPNTIEALEVEPLPFHGMSGYPYRADERFPDGEAHRTWRREWLTRPALRWIAPVSPAREVEWVLDGT